jgi:hypothetical protein
MLLCVGVGSHPHSHLVSAAWALLQIDIEGFETLALRGARGLLDDATIKPCHLFVEYWARYVEWSGVPKEVRL